MKNEKLTEEQKDFIKKNIGKLSIVRISEKLGMNYRVVYYYATKNTDKRRHHKFTEQEDQFIKAQYASMRVESIADCLGLTKTEIYNRARALNIRKFARK